MRPSQKLALTDAIARELERRYSFSEVDTYLTEYRIKTPYNFNDFDDASDYSKATLRGAEPATLLSIAEDLEIHAALTRSTTPPRNWPDLSKFRLFVSHIARDKDKGTRLRDCLAPHHISCFIAHQDIRPTAEWQIEIERALSTMDAFLAIHTAGFSQSFWTQQEIGFAFARRVKIISLRMGEDPTAFISKQQALPRLNRSAEEIAQEVKALLLDDQATAPRLQEVIAANTPKPTSDPLDDEIPF